MRDIYLIRPFPLLAYMRYVNLMPYPEFALTLSDEPRENPEDAETDAQSAKIT